MCFVLEQGALFRHCNFQKWSECVVSETFWLRSALRATTPCTLQHATSKFLRSCGVLYIFTWKCASRHNAVHFFNISTFKSAPNPLCFSHFDVQMCFPPQRCALFRHPHIAKIAETLEKHSVSRLFYLFAHLDLLWSSFFWILFFSHSLSSHLWFFHLSKLSEVWLLNFLRYYIYIENRNFSATCEQNPAWSKMTTPRISG